MQGWTNIKIKFLYLYVKALRMIKEFNLKKVKLEIYDTVFWPFPKIILLLSFQSI